MTVVLEYKIRCLCAVRTRASLNQCFFGDDGDAPTAGEITAKPNAHADNRNYLISILIISSCHPDPTPSHLCLFSFFIYFSLFLHLFHFLSLRLFILSRHTVLYVACIHIVQPYIELTRLT